MLLAVREEHIHFFTGYPVFRECCLLGDECRSCGHGEAEETSHEAVIVVVGCCLFVDLFRVELIPPVNIKDKFCQHYQEPYAKECDKNGYQDLNEALLKFGQSLFLFVLLIVIRAEYHAALTGGTGRITLLLIFRNRGRC